MLEPKGFDLYLRYECKCGENEYLRLPEAKTESFKWVCICGQVNQIRQIESANIQINFAKKVNLVDEAYDVLKNYGFSKWELKQFAPQIKVNNVENWVKKFLELQEI